MGFLAIAESPLKENSQAEFSFFCTQKQTAHNKLCKPNICLKNSISVIVTFDFCNFDALVGGNDSCVHVDNYVETVDYFSKLP